MTEVVQFLVRWVWDEPAMWPGRRPDPVVVDGDYEPVEMEGTVATPVAAADVVATRGVVDYSSPAGIGREAIVVTAELPFEEEEEVGRGWTQEKV